MSGIETGAEGPAQAPVTADGPARADVGTGTLTGPVGQPAADRGAAHWGAAHRGTVHQGAARRGAAGPAGLGNGAGPRPAPSGPSTGSSQPSIHDRVLGWLVVLVPAVAGLAVGGYKIGYPSLWRDEASTKTVVGRSVGQIFALLHHTDAVHGAYYVLMHFVVGVLGTSATALRLPSLLGMTVACAFTAAIGRRLVVLAGAPLARFTGLCAGLVFATAPYMTRYAQEARSYAIVTMFATIATYLLLRAASDGRRWWAAYGVAIALCGLFNVFALLILVPHGLSLLIARARERAAVAHAAVALTRGETVPGGRSPGLSAFAPDGLTGRRMAGLPLRWLIASGAAVLVLIPLGAVAFGQRSQVNWMTRPKFGAVVSLAYNAAGSWRLIAPVFALAVGGVLAGLIVDRSRRPLTPGVVAFPWMVLPPAILIGVSEVRPIYDERYVEFCLPALAILVAWGIAWIVRLAAATPLRNAGIAWLPSAIVIVGLVALLVSPDKQIRLNSARPDNLEAAATVIGAAEKPGDIILYVPGTGRVVGTAYPAPFRKLRDIELARPPLASATIAGTAVSPSVLRSRFVHVTRVWTMTGIPVSGNFPGTLTPTDQEELKLVSGMQRIAQWWDGDTILTLYAARS